MIWNRERSDRVRLRWEATPPTPPTTRSLRSRFKQFAYTAPIASEQLCPPNPKLLLSTFVTRTSRATFGM